MTDGKSSAWGKDAGSLDLRALWITYGNIALYGLCYQLQRPVEPFLVKFLTEKAEAGDGASSVSRNYGRLESFFSTVQTIGSPLVGLLVDRIGIRKTWTVVFLASAASYAMLAAATTLPELFASKVPAALQHAFLLAQATAAMSTGENASDRARALGRMTTAYTIGATIGPALGGYLAGENGDLYCGARLAVIGSLLSALLSFFLLTDGPGHSSSTKGESQNNSHSDAKPSFGEEFRRLPDIVARRHLWPLLVIKLMGGTAASMHSTALPLSLTQKLHFRPSQLGIVMSTSMLAVAAFGALAMAPLTSALGTARLAQFGLALRAAMAFIIAAIVGTSDPSAAGMQIYVVTSTVIHALASHALATSITTQTTGSVYKSERGTLLGLEHALFSLARMGGPAMGTALLALGDGEFWIVAAICATVDYALVASLASFRKSPSEHYSEKRVTDQQEQHKD